MPFSHKNEFRSILRKSGLKSTPSRIAILTAFKGARHPLSAQEIIDIMEKGADPVTVYRTIKSLKTRGIIRQVDLRHNHAHFELTGLKEHHHLICLKCARVEDVGGCGVEEMQEKILRQTRHFDQIQQHSLEFYGICRACARPSGDRVESGSTPFRDSRNSAGVV